MNGPSGWSASHESTAGWCIQVVELTLRVLSGTRQGGPSGAPREKVLHIEVSRQDGLSGPLAAVEC